MSSSNFKKICSVFTTTIYRNLHQLFNCIIVLRVILVSLWIGYVLDLSSLTNQESGKKKDMDYATLSKPYLLAYFKHGFCYVHMGLCLPLHAIWQLLANGHADNGLQSDLSSAKELLNVILKQLVKYSRWMKMQNIREEKEGKKWVA